MFKNWKTTLGGVGSVITGIALFVNGKQLEGLTAISLGFSAICAKDFNK